ncbi:MAG: aminotransferase class V-fold PLP-dependent enzyme [Actinomycetota bacterium]|nr:aminotransferase class V-fold PLP-dependent enzyme [Actinomycetota bacterium]
MFEPSPTDALVDRLDSFRRDTPAVELLLHFNNAGAALSPRPVVDAVIGHVELEAQVGGYEAAALAADAEAVLYRSAAHLLNCEQREVAFAVSASEAWWRAFSALPLQAGDRVLCGHSEYISNAFGLIQARNRGVSVELIPDDKSGQIDLEELEAALDERVKLVALTHVPTSSGLVNPAEEVGALAKNVGALYLLDACQSAGQLPLDVQAIGCDFLSITGRKFLRAPRGTGLLFARSSVLPELGHSPFIDGRSAQWTSPWEYQLDPTARRFELFEVSYAAKLGLGVAIDYALDVGLDRIAHRVGRLAAALRSALVEVPGVEVHDQGERRCGIVTFSIGGMPASEVTTSLRQRRINTSFGTASAAQFDLGLRGVPEVVRASVHYYNTEDEVGRFVDEVRTLAVTV